MAPAAQRHVFYVHSHLTSIVARSVVETLGLNPDDVLVLLGRGFQAPYADLRSVPLKPSQCAIALVPSYGERFLFLRRYAALRSIDRTISDFLAGATFAVYLPSTRNFLMQFLATHRKCVELHLLEEGLLTYTGNALKAANPYYSSSIAGRLKRWGKIMDHGNRSLYYFDRKSRPEPTIFGVSPDLKSDLPGWHVRVLENLIVPTIPDCYILNGKSVFFMDLVAERGFVSLASVAHVLISIGKRMADRAGLWLKWHPGQRWHRCIVEILDRNGVPYKIIPESVAPEAILLRSQNLTVYGFHSSLLYYASLWGHCAISLMGVLEKLDPGFTERHARLRVPPAFYRRVMVPDTLPVVGM